MFVGIYYIQILGHVMRLPSYLMVEVSFLAVKLVENV